MVQTKADRERQKLITDKCQALIELLLREEDNKYCVDCDAKGPRWASWNLGIFLCIRCAGIHRNLGVHISRVKSVNLDAWSPEHVAYMQRMGNSRARAIYEANLADDFTRPQTDTSLESFIRAKYEHKRYIAQDYMEPGPPEPAFNADEELKRMKEQKRNKLNSGSNKTMISVSDSFVPAALAASSTSVSNSSKSQSQQQQQQKRPSLLLNSDSFAPSPTVGSATTNSNPNSKPKSNLEDLMDLDLGFGSGSGSSNILSSNISSTMNNSMTNFSAFSTSATNFDTSPATILPISNTSTLASTNSLFRSNNHSFNADSTPVANNSSDSNKNNNNNQPITGNTGAKQLCIEESID